MTKEPKNRHTISLSEAAKIMRTSADPVARKEAASLMGKAGGPHSHDNDPIKYYPRNNREDQAKSDSTES